MRPQRGRPGPVRGLSLLECLVALSLGLVVVGAVLSQHLASGRTARLQAAQAQMSEDAQIALQLLGTELQMAGYARPRSLAAGQDGRTRWVTPLSEAPVFACDGGFVAPSTPGAVACAAGSASAALEVRYEADAYNTVPLSGSTQPSDCLGAGLSASEGAFLTANRWYVAASQGRTELRCASRLGNPGQPLVDNVEALVLWFAEASAADPAQPVRYVRASQVADFARVRSVRLCLLLRSTDPVLGLDTPADYLDCDGGAQTSADRRLRRAFFATVALRQRSGG